MQILIFFFCENNFLSKMRNVNIINLLTKSQFTLLLDNKKKCKLINAQNVQNMNQKKFSFFLSDFN